MNKIIVYGTAISSTTRAVWLTVEALGLDVEKREVALSKGDHLKEEYLKINPQHTVPTIDDNGFILVDSHAIMGYLVDKHGKDNALYPKDLKTRSLIDRYLHFDNDMFAMLKFTCKELFNNNRKEILETVINLLKEFLLFIDEFLRGRDWLVGDNYTIADISCFTSVISIMALISEEPYSNLNAWVKRCREQFYGYDRVCKTGEDLFSYAISLKWKKCEL